MYAADAVRKSESRRRQRMRLIDADRLIISFQNSYVDFESEKDYKLVSLIIGNTKTVEAYTLDRVKEIEERTIRETKAKCRKIGGRE
jgi:hypothetical protein